MVESQVKVRFNSIPSLEMISNKDPLSASISVPCIFRRFLAESVKVAGLPLFRVVAIVVVILSVVSRDRFKAGFIQNAVFIFAPIIIIKII